MKDISPMTSPNPSGLAKSALRLLDTLGHPDLARSDDVEGIRLAFLSNDDIAAGKRAVLGLGEDRSPFFVRQLTEYILKIRVVH
jgi:hypothetical protein